MLFPSLAQGYVPPSLKVARLSPAFKKKSVDHEEFINYRLISNLNFLSKTIERVVARELRDYLLENDLFSELQSAYHRNHSTETALLRVQNDMLLALDGGNEVLLVLLDYSAAFDTIDHSILIWRLENRFGISGTVLSLFRSYLKSRCQLYVSIKGSNSSVNFLS